MAFVGVVALGLVTLVGPGPAGAVMENPDLDSSAEYTYRIDPEGGEIEVTIVLSLTADRPNRTTSTGYYQYYFDSTLLAIPSDVGDLTITDGQGRALSWEVDSELEDAEDLLVRFRRNLFYRQTTQVVATFTLPGGAPRSEGLTRVNGAYAGFQAWVDPRVEEATVTLVTPYEFVDRSIGSDPFGRPTVEDGEQHFVVDDLDPEEFWAGVSLARDAALVSTDVDFEEHGIEIRAWPGDTEWQRFVNENIDTGLTELIDVVGLPWPLTRELVIIESFTPYLNGYAGWYDASVDEIEIGDELDTHVVFHELSHVWFNDQLFEDRWITEGLADEFGAAVVESLGEERPTPPRTEAGGRWFQPLNQWDNFTDNANVEEWSYGASWTVTGALADLVGLDGLSEVIQATEADTIPYVGDGPPEEEFRRNDWRLYLDLLTNLEGADEPSIVGQFDRWVVDADQAELLDERAEARDRYADLAEAGGAWAPPLVVRTAMSDWDFDDADELIGAADDVLTERDRTIEAIDPLGASLPPSLEEAYEQAEDDLTEAADLADEVFEVALALRDADTALDDATGPLQRIGAIAGDYEADLAAAIDEFEAGDLDEAADGAASIERDVDDLSRRGLVRLGIALVLLAAVVVGLWWWLRRRRRSRRPVTDDGPLALLPSGLEPTPARPELPAGELQAAEPGTEAEPEAEPSNLPG